MSYSDAAFDAALEEIEALLADLYGIEAAAQAVIDYAYAHGGAGQDQNPMTTVPLTLPARRPFEVYPTLPLASVELERDGGYQPWLTAAFEAGKAQAGGTAAWLKAVADNYYLVDAQAIIAAAQEQSRLTHEVGARIVGDAAEVSGNLAVHWESDAKEQFFEWFPSAASVVSALLFYADSAQLSAGAAGDVIAATQKTLMRQAEEGVVAVQEAVAAWRDDYDVFPFTPGSGFLFSQIGSAVSERIEEYSSRIPAGGFLADKLIGKAVSKIPHAAAALEGYSILTQLEVKDMDPKTPASASQLSAEIEGALRTIVVQGDVAIGKLGDKIAALAAEVASEPLLVLERLPRTPSGSYTA